MTDRYETIRKALEMGPTPGPRKWWENEAGYCCVNPCDGGLWIAKCDVRDPFDPEQRANAALIAACDPDTIRTLLAERDALAASLAAAREDVSTERRALIWLSGRDSGMSSVAICRHMLGMKSDGSFPRHPADLGCCLRLLERFPEWKPRIGEMARYSRVWAELAARWDDLAELMAAEVGIDWSKGRMAPLTYAAMKDAIDQARGKESGND